MEEFKKWAGPAFYYGQDPSNRPTLEAKREAWKAALKWVLKNITLSPLGKKTIEKELGEK